jgi:hypothetical protein
VSRPALLVIGLWLGLLVASWIMATTNFRTADHVLGPAARPEVAAKLGGVAPEDRRLVLRHLASEINRSMFRTWAFTQLALGAVLAALLWQGPRGARLLAFIALGLTVAQAASLMPAITTLGRSLDFVPRPLPPEVARSFGWLHAGYMTGDALKAIALVATAIAFLRRG